MERKNFAPIGMRKGLFTKTDKPDKGRTKPDGDRRQLKTYQLVPPDYMINPQVLLDNYVEVGIRFAGIIPRIPTDVDPTMRTDILKIIDSGKKQELIPWYISHEHDAIFSLSAYNVKISKRNSPEELLIRVAIHDIAAICYIKDDASYILALKYGEVDLPKDTCNLAVFYCDGRTSAEEICSLVGQCFQLVYTDATMQFFDRQLLDGVNGSHQHYMNSMSRRETENGHAFLTDSIVDAGSSTRRSLSRVGIRRRPSTSRSIRSESDLSTSARDLLHDYMRRLHTKLTSDELCRFAMLLKAWHTDLPFQEFCNNVLELYGPQRKHLLAGMRPFIPEEDYVYFENFLERHGVNGGSPKYMIPDDFNRYNRTMSEVSGTSSISATMHDEEPINMDEIDQMLSEISQEIQTMETSVDANLDPYASP